MHSVGPTTFGSWEDDHVEHVVAVAVGAHSSAFSVVLEDESHRRIAILSAKIAVEEEIC